MEMVEGIGRIGLQRLTGALARMDKEKKAEVYRILMEDAPGYKEMPAGVREADMTLMMEEGVRALRKITSDLYCQQNEARTADTPVSGSAHTQGSHCREHHRAAQEPGIPDQFSHPDSMSAGSRSDGQGAQDNQP
jgi:hypothetical protein